MLTHAGLPPGPSSSQLFRRLLLNGSSLPQFLRSAAGQYGDLLYLPFPGRPALLVNQPQTVSHLLAVSQPEHAGLLNPALLNQFAPHFGPPAWLPPGLLVDSSRLYQAVAESLAGYWPRWDAFASGGGTLNWQKEMERLAVLVVWNILLGSRTNGLAARIEDLLPPALDFLATQSRSLFRPEAVLMTPAKIRFRLAASTLQLATSQMLAERREAAGSGSDLLSAAIKSGSRDDVLHGGLAWLLAASSSALASLLTWSAVLVAQNPSFAPAGMDSERAIMLETARLYPPAWLVALKILPEQHLRRLNLPAGVQIMISPYLLQRRPDMWPEPECFQPERFGNNQSIQQLGNLPFGNPGICPGTDAACTAALVDAAAATSAAIRARYQINLLQKTPVQAYGGYTLKVHGALPVPMGKV